MKALVTSSRKVDDPAKKKRRLKEKVDSSDPVIGQPAPGNKLRGRAAMVNGETAPFALELMKVTCPECSAEAELKDFNDFFGYKLICPVLRDHLAKRTPDNGIDCPHMGPVIRLAVLQIRIGKRRRRR